MSPLIETCLETPTARAVVTTRVIDLRSRQGEAELAAALGRPIARGEQVHGAEVVAIESAPADPVRGADGLATRSKIALLALGADCPGVALLGARSVAVAHSGWRGTVADVAPKAVDALAAFGEKRSEIRACVGPGIALCCFEVGLEVVDAFEQAFGKLSVALVPRSGDKAHVDLHHIIRQRLVERGGLSEQNVKVDQTCTKCGGRDKFFSRRREGPGCGHHAVAAYLL